MSNCVVLFPSMHLCTGFIQYISVTPHYSTLKRVGLYLFAYLFVYHVSLDAFYRIMDRLFYGFCASFSHEIPTFR